MEDIKEIKEIVQILFFLLPGFLTAKMLEMWVITKPKDVFDRVVQAFVLTFVNLICFAFIRWLLEKLVGFQFDHDQFFAINNLLLMVFCAVRIAIILSFELNNELVLTKLRKWKITKKTYKPCTWVETFEHVERLVVVHLNDGRRIYGWPKFYSDDPAERAIFLEEASWLDDENNLINNPPISILLDGNSGIQFVEFLQEVK
jgi:hypothetical protein